MQTNTKKTKVRRKTKRKSSNQKSLVVLFTAMWYHSFPTLKLKWLQWKFLIVDNAIEIYIGLIAIFFTILGVWVATQLVKPQVQEVIIEKEVLISQPDDFTINEEELNKLNLSSREYEVLQLLSIGLSNAEIATNLFLSVSTIKTHVSNLYTKMDVQSRTQAIEKSKRLKIIP